MQLQNYASGQWIAGSGKQADLIDAITGDPAYRQAGSSVPPPAEGWTSRNDQVSWPLTASCMFAAI